MNAIFEYATRVAAGNDAIHVFSFSKPETAGSIIVTAIIPAKG